MIKPENYRPQKAQDEAAAIEQHFDKCISRSTATEGAIHIQRVRSPWSADNINYVINKYRNAGWIVIVGDSGGRGYYCSLMIPETGRTTDPSPDPT